MAEPCNVRLGSSRTCERGTKGCVATHDVASATVNLDPELCLELAAEFKKQAGMLTPRARRFTDAAAQLTAAANLKPLDVERVRSVVREAIAADHGWMSTVQSAQADAIATRVASQLTGAVVGGLSATDATFLDAALQFWAREDVMAPRGDIERIRKALPSHAPVDIDSAARTITGQSAEQLTARLDAEARLHAYCPECGGVACHAPECSTRPPVASSVTERHGAQGEPATGGTRPHETAPGHALQPIAIGPEDTAVIDEALNRYAYDDDAPSEAIARIRAALTGTVAS